MQHSKFEDNNLIFEEVNEEISSLDRQIVQINLFIQHGMICWARVEEREKRYKTI